MAEWKYTTQYKLHSSHSDKCAFMVLLTESGKFNCLETPLDAFVYNINPLLCNTLSSSSYQFFSTCLLLASYLIMHFSNPSWSFPSHYFLHLSHPTSSHSHLTSSHPQALPYKLPLREAQPPFTRLITPILKYSRQQANC